MDRGSTAKHALRPPSRVHEDTALPDLLSFRACSKSCRSAATRDGLWREREGLLAFTYGLPDYEGESWAEAEAALPADRRLPDEFVDPMLLDHDGYLELTPFQQYLSLSRFRNRVHKRLISFGSEDAWSEADRRVLDDLVDSCEEAIELAVELSFHDDNCPYSAEECLSQCTRLKCARHFVECVYYRLEEGDSEGVVGNMRDLIIGGIAKARYQGFSRGGLDEMPLHMRFPLDFCTCCAVDIVYDS